jgi:hypothetical protein
VKGGPKTGLLSDNSSVFCVLPSQIRNQLICSPGPIAQNNLPWYLGGFCTNYFTFRNDDIFKNYFLQRTIISKKKRIFRNIPRILKFRNAIIKNNKLLGTHVLKRPLYYIVPNFGFWNVA